MGFKDSAMRLMKETGDYWGERTKNFDKLPMYQQAALTAFPATAIPVAAGLVNNYAQKGDMAGVLSQTASTFTAPYVGVGKAAATGLRSLLPASGRISKSGTAAQVADTLYTPQDAPEEVPDTGRELIAQRLAGAAPERRKVWQQRLANYDMHTMDRSTLKNTSTLDNLTGGIARGIRGLFAR